MTGKCVEGDDILEGLRVKEGRKECVTSVNELDEFRDFLDCHPQRRWNVDLGGLDTRRFLGDDLGRCMAAGSFQQRL